MPKISCPSAAISARITQQRDHRAGRRDLHVHPPGHERRERRGIVLEEHHAVARHAGGLGVARRDAAARRAENDVAAGRDVGVAADVLRIPGAHDGGIRHPQCGIGEGDQPAALRRDVESAGRDVVTRGLKPWNQCRKLRHHELKGTHTERSHDSADDVHVEAAYFALGTSEPPRRLVVDADRDAPSAQHPILVGQRWPAKEQGGKGQHSATSDG